MTRPRLVIFARFPVPGTAKTRLIPALGPAGAARLQDAMTRHTLCQAAGVADVADVEVRFTGCDAAAMSHRYSRRFAGAAGGTEVRYEPQGDGDLGDRLARATAGGGPVVVVGTDCPALTADLLRTALAELSRHDVVLGPATDGGYYLIALGRPAPTLFAGIDWSTDRVLAQTRAAAEVAGLSVAVLPPLSDVDEPEDLPAARTLLPPEPPPPGDPSGPGRRPTMG